MITCTSLLFVCSSAELLAEVDIFGPQQCHETEAADPSVAEHAVEHCCTTAISGADFLSDSFNDEDLLQPVCDLDLCPLSDEDDDLTV